MSTRGHGREALAWAAVLAVVAIALPLLDYQTRDPDSVLYAEMAARMSAAPVDQWIAPEWPPGSYMRGPYREHPVGIFVPAALLARLGYPPAQAAYALNAVYQVLTLVLIARLAASLVAPEQARALLWLLQLLPIAFTYRVRANQEQVALVLLVAAVLGTERSRSRPLCTLLTAASLAALLLVKGVLGLMGLLACALWLVARRGAPGPARTAWWGLGGAVAAMGLATATYEWLYRDATGEPFVSFYLARQLGIAAVPQSEALLAQKAYNLVWYLGRVLWFSVPWSLTLAALAWSGRRCERSPARSGVVFTLALTALYVGLFSVSDRRADRYIFPVYYAVGACGGLAALEAWPRFRALAARIDCHAALAPALLFLLAFALHLASGRLLHLPTIKVWAPDS